jgi:hypothetical protein
VGAPVTGQRRHEAPEVGDAVVRMLRGLVRRAGEGDTEAVEQLRRLDNLTGSALCLGLLSATRAGYSTRELGRVMGTSGVAVVKRLDVGRAIEVEWSRPDGYVHPDQARLCAGLRAPYHEADAIAESGQTSTPGATL